MDSILQMTAMMKINSVVERTMKAKDMTADDINDFVAGIIEPATTLAERLTSIADQIQYYADINPTQFELLKNSPNLLEIAKDYSKQAVLTAFRHRVTAVVQWFDDPEMTSEVLTSAMGL